jgi:STE24 endopeptidase
MDRHRVRLPLAIAVAAVAAGAATVALRPRGLIHPARVDATAYFSASELDRIHDFRGPQRILGLLALATEGVALVWIAFRPPRQVRRALERAGVRPLAGAAAVGAGAAVVIVVLTLPESIIGQQRQRDYGLSTQSWGSWTGDLLKSTAVGVVLTALAALILMALIRRFPRSWFVGGAIALVLLTIVFEYVSPVVIDPLFNKFTPLPQGPLRSSVLNLAERSNIDVGQVYRVNASTQTTGTNAYVTGVGATKRVVLYDTLIDSFSGDQIDSIVAHELGHVKHRDVPRGLLWIAIVALPGMFLVQTLTDTVAGRRRPPGKPGPALLPAAALSIALVSFVMQIPGNALSRRVEGSADAYALRLTNDSAAFIAVQRKLAEQNISDPDPPGWLQFLFGTHPTTVTRIGYGLTWARAH